jgi:hypothetical protein
MLCTRDGSILLCVLALACGGDDGGTDDAGDTTLGGSTAADDDDDDADGSTDPSSTVTMSSMSEDSGSTGVDGSSDGADASSDDGSSTGVADCTLSSEWEIVEDWTPSPTEGAKSGGIGFAPTGEIYVGGAIEPVPNEGRWLVRKSVDDGASWETVDDFELVPGLGGGAGGPVFDGDGRVFVVGAAGHDQDQSHRIVRRSDDGGASWETVDDFSHAAGYASYAGGIAIGSDGTLWTVGQSGSATAAHWIVRTSSDGGDSWSTADDFQLVAGQICLPSGVDVMPDAAPVVAGRCFVSMTEMHWIVRTMDGGGGWATIDELVLGSSSSASAPFVAGDRVWVGGSATIDGVGHWLVRRSDDGSSWETIDDWVDDGGVGTGMPGFVSAGAVVEHGDGVVLATGTRSEAGTPPRAITRRSDDDGATWETIDDFAYGSAIYIGDLAIAPNRSVYNSGIALGDDGRAHWFLRRLSCD